MKRTIKRNDNVVLELTKDEGKHLWVLVRQGRRAIVDNSEGYNSSFAMDVMQAMPLTDMGFLEGLLKVHRAEDHEKITKYKKEAD